MDIGIYVAALNERSPLKEGAFVVGHRPLAKDHPHSGEHGFSRQAGKDKSASVLLITMTGLSHDNLYVIQRPAGYIGNH
jgi:hypothetical protein